MKFVDIIDSLKHNNKDGADAMAGKLLYGMIKLNQKEKTFLSLIEVELCYRTPQLVS